MLHISEILLTKNHNEMDFYQTADEPNATIGLLVAEAVRELLARTSYMPLYVGLPYVFRS